jgi:oxygen-independent coproporphyrinogen-3 oxidase
LDRDEITGEFMLNALRLNGGFTLELFSARTGVDAAALEPQLEALCRRELLVRHADCVTATDLGRRFLDSVVAEFFPG